MRIVPVLVILALALPALAESTETGEPPPCESAQITAPDDSAPTDQYPPELETAEDGASPRDRGEPASEMPAGDPCDDDG